MTEDDTLQGISLKYGVTIEELRRVNKLFGDSIHLRESLLVPLRTSANENQGEVLPEKKVTKEDDCSEFTVETNTKSKKVVETNTKSKKVVENSKPEKKCLEKKLSVDRNLSALNFLQKIDSTISESKKAVNSFCSKKQGGV